MSPYAVKLATRHLLAHPGQSALLMAGVALGVSVFIFMSALIGGLATLLTLRTVGSIPHIVLEMPDRDPAVLPVPGGAQVVLQKDLSRRNQIAIWQPAIPIIEKTSGVTAVSPQIRGSAFVERGQAVAPVGIIGVQSGKLSAIADIEGAIVEGSSSLPADGILIGSRLASDLGLRVGQVVRLSSDRGRARSFRIGGVFTLGVASADRQAIYMNFTAARALFDLPTGISRIEIKVQPATDAPRIAERLRRSTGLKATAWTEDNTQLFEGLDAQARTGTIIKAFSLITIVVGIASAMLLSIVRRKAEVGIMRAMGASKRLVISVFVLEGTLIGLIGALVGALAAWAALLPLPPVTEVRSGGLPIDRGQGDYLLAITLTTLAAMLASILPARNAARIDPVEAIGQ
ncbi:ABC transporter permease [Novosphingobium sp. TH158]|uniref:ABC transporter permease n=1 Tax=Novosphingobium sp. TH158 TaxID=2067455 RepID=UPI000C7D0689|nr:ABC transporter permease [Novosphingobium sp. TH158]PLK25721.1 ABC transporter permease [Novosphingobium sp. TH158]